MQHPALTRVSLLLGALVLVLIAPGPLFAGKVIFKDVDEPIKDRLTELQKQVSNARADALNREIAARLFQGEARRRCRRRRRSW